VYNIAKDSEPQNRTNINTPMTIERFASDWMSNSRRMERILAWTE
jgi:hypothetical protein